MKRFLAMVLAASACLVLMTACGGKPAEKDGGKQPATADVVKAVAAELKFKDAMMDVDSTLISNFYTLDMSKVESVSMYTSGTRATAEEVTVIKMMDAADIKLAQDAAATRIADQKIAYENYVPEEMVKINAAVVYTHGNYLLLVMADDTSSVEETFNAQF